MQKNQEQESKCSPGLRIKRFLGVGKGISILLFILFVLISPVHAESNDCEKLAKDYQRVHGGDLILVQPLKDNGAYIMGAYAGHWINRAWDKQRGSYYYDDRFGIYFSNKSEVKETYEACCYNKVEILNYNQGEVPFGIIWHY